VVAGAGKYDETLLRTIDWMLKIDEADRPASVAQVRQALSGKVLPQAGRQDTPPVPDQAQATGTPRPRRGRAVAIAISLVLAGLGAGSYAFYANYEAKQQAAHQADMQAKQQAERQVQEASERQRQLADQLANAGTDPTKLEQFLTACGSSCPDALRSQAHARIDTAKLATAASRADPPGRSSLSRGPRRSHEAAGL